LRIDRDTGKVEKEPGYGRKGLETEVEDNVVYTHVMSEQGVDYEDLKVDVNELHEILEAKGMLPKDPNSKYPCGGGSRPLYNFIHEADKKLSFVDGEGGKGYVFNDVRLLKTQDNGKTAKEILEHLFDKAQVAGNGMQTQYKINPLTHQEELTGISKYDNDALGKLGREAKIELYLNGIKSPLDAKVNAGDKLCLAYVAPTAQN